MSGPQPDPSPDLPQQQPALPKWDNEVGTGPFAPELSPLSEGVRIPMPKTAEAELGALRVRVIALENLVIALLASGTHQQRELAGRMNPHIAPRPGFTNHPLTTRAAAHLTDLIERAARLHDGK
jgi:hypothetical protein